MRYKNRAAGPPFCFFSSAVYLHFPLNKKKKKKKKKPTHSLTQPVDMRVLSLLPVVAGLLAGAEAHTRVYGIWLNGVRPAVRVLAGRQTC